MCVPVLTPAARPRGPHQGLRALTAALRSHSLDLTAFRAAVGRILALRRDVTSGRPLPPP